MQPETIVNEEKLHFRCIHVLEELNLRVSVFESRSETVSVFFMSLANIASCFWRRQESLFLPEVIGLECLDFEKWKLDSWMGLHYTHSLYQLFADGPVF